MRHVFVVLSLLAAAEAAGQEPEQEDEAPISTSEGEDPAGGEPELLKVRRFGIQLSAALGSRWADGSMLSTAGNPAYASEMLHPIDPDLFLVLDYPLNRYFGAQAGLSFVAKGSESFADIYDYYYFNVRLQYLTIPLMLRLEVPFEGKVGVFRPYLRGGIAGDLVLSKGGEWAGRDLATETTFYNGHRGYNLSFLWGVGMELGIFENPSFLFGIDLLFENHLLDEFNASKWGGANWRYGNVYFGAHLTYQMYATGP